MRAGLLRHRIELQKLVTTENEWGDPVKEWRTIATVWALVEALGGRLYFEAQQTVAQSDHRMIIRYRPDVEPGMRVLHGGKSLEIQAVLDREGRKRWLEVLAKVVTV